MTDEIIKLLDELAKRFGVAIDWTSENVMPYLLDLYERFIDYRLVVNLIPIIACVILTTLTIEFFIKVNKDLKGEKETLWVTRVKEWHGSYYYMTKSGLCEVLEYLLPLVCVALLIFSVCAVGNILELIFVPEAYVIDYLKTYIR